MGIAIAVYSWYAFGMGKRVENQDYAKPLFTRIYRKHRVMLDALVASFPRVTLKNVRKDGTDTRLITETEVVQIAIEEMHHRRIIEKTVTWDKTPTP